MLTRRRTSTLGVTARRLELGSAGMAVATTILFDLGFGAVGALTGFGGAANK